MLNAAIVGLGWWGRHIVNCLRDSSNLRVVLAIDPNSATRAFAELHNLDYATELSDALCRPGIDAVILTTPHSLHTMQILACAAAGKHVFCEKPLALTRADALLSVHACEQAGVVLGIGHERRYEPAIEHIRSLVKTGALGTFLHAEANFSHNRIAHVPANDWRSSLKDSPAAGMTGTGVHLSDAFIDMFGEVDSIYATTSKIRPEKPNGDIVSVHLRFAAGGTAYLNSILMTPLYIRFVVFGSRGWAEARNSTHPDTPGPTSLQIRHQDGTSEDKEFSWTDTVRQNLEAFADAAEGRAPYRFTHNELVGNVAVLEAICTSAAEERSIQVNNASIDHLASPNSS